MGNKLTIDTSGPFFRGDPKKKVTENIHDFMDRVAELGEAEVRTRIQSASMPNSTGWTAAHVRGRTRSLGGKRWRVSAVVSIDASGLDSKLAIRTMAAGSSVEGRFHPFRRVTAGLRRAAKQLDMDLLKGLT